LEKIRVLVVEDDPMVAEVNKDFVQAVAGFEVAGLAFSGRSALEKIRELAPDLVLLDVYLPDISGLETLQEIRRQRLPVDVIMITAAHDAETIQNLLRYGANDYIIKPFKFSRLKRALDNYNRFRVSLRKNPFLRQEDLDRISNLCTPWGQEELPKGLSEITLKQIQEHLFNSPTALSAEEIARALGLARVTARRYLDYLVRKGVAKLEIQYGSIGRPVNRYRS